MTATQKEMKDARLPLGYRDSCAHLLIPLNKCRSETYYLPFKCQDERHIYEKCQYDDYLRRMKAAEEKKRAGSDE
ncbi:NADH dehydrogenase 1 beta subcomplex subunit 7 ndufb7 [Entomortierella chlamydospora]|uniref:NADH dehydrogenase [ubiquinone] 1 beta subcomplex subunit 7 n=1 Tax=Entomortierella chlamydospora TaxID=101097 RepID=A0A9P6SY30_9FUNG|nr:NADH dehydrogenase 1 beta subcomplex subunit 7 ndufb7 [Entomortierella chlamydospora]KAG0010777.1 NADH dehydrogenase 1 beta subcomplex subunit 7 ndufb7 [Entomortierella chlamydospora]